MMIEPSVPEAGWRVRLHGPENHPMGSIVRVAREPGTGEIVCVVQPERRFAQPLYLSVAFVRRWRA